MKQVVFKLSHLGLLYRKRKRISFSKEEEEEENEPAGIPVLYSVSLFPNLYVPRRLGVGRLVGSR